MSGLFGLGRKKHENEAETTGTGTGTGVGTGSGTGTGTGLGSGNNTGIPFSSIVVYEWWRAGFSGRNLAKQFRSVAWHGC